jgi:hypothetical protein
MKKHVIYFGKLCIGKSTYLNTLKTGYVDFDKFIWTQLNDKGIMYFKNEFLNAINEGNKSRYNKIIKELNSELDWTNLIKEADKISKVYEMPALGMWWKYLPTDLKENSHIIRLMCKDFDRIERASKRGCVNKLQKFDLFYKEPPIINNSILI